MDTTPPESERLKIVVSSTMAALATRRRSLEQRDGTGIGECRQMAAPTPE
jgi:hypothetical protein